MKITKDSFFSFFKGLKQITVEPYLFFCLFGYAVRLVTFQSIIIDRSCRNLHYFSDDICSDIDNDDHELHKAASIEAGNNLYSGYMLIGSIPAIVVAIFLGPWSDKYSRKYPLIIAASGMTLEGTASAIFTFFPELSPLWYISANIFAGLSGGLIIAMSATFSYMSDITDERSRSSRYAFLEFASIAAFIAGTVIGGTIFKKAGTLPNMILAPCAFATALIYTAIFVKDSKVRTPDQTFSVMIRDLITVGNVKDSYKTCSKKRPGNIRLQLWLLVFISCSQKFVYIGTGAIAYPFASKMYNWDVTEFSNATTAIYMVNAFSTVAIIPYLSRKLLLHEAALGAIGMLSLTSLMAVTSLAYIEPVFYFAWISGALASACHIGTVSRLSKLIGKDELGRAFSLLGTFDSITPLLGTLAFVQMFNASVLVFPGLAFAVAAVFLIPSVLIFCWMMNLPSVYVGDYGGDSFNDVKDNSQQSQEKSSKYIPMQENKF